MEGEWFDILGVVIALIFQRQREEEKLSKNMSITVYGIIVIQINT